MKKVLLTGACGYIGSHAAIQLLQEGYEIAIVDSLVNSDKSVVARIESYFKVKIPFLENNLLTELENAKNFILEFQPDYVMHFAGLKSVNESVERPLMYWENNVSSSANLLKMLESLGKKITFVFSSSATVYLELDGLPFKERDATGPISPYGDTKLAIEKLIQAHSKASKNFTGISLRYFNPVGANNIGLACENPSSPPNNIMPKLVQAALTDDKEFHIFGSDYNTSDGTCIRDYIHICDLIDGHILAMTQLKNTNKYFTLNLGTGNGASVAKIISTFEVVNNIKFKTIISPRRLGDVESSIADPKEANGLLGWQAEKSLNEMCKDSWDVYNILYSDLQS